MSLFCNRIYRFGEFTLDGSQKVLFRQGRPLALTPKALDTLLILIESDGRLIEKQEFMNRLWPDTFVEESNLAFNVQQLRKCLGDSARNPSYIETIARRGYRFIARVDVVDDPSANIDQYAEIQSPDAPRGPRSDLAREESDWAEPTAFGASLTPAPTSFTTSRNFIKKSVGATVALIGLALLGLIYFSKDSTTDPNGSISGYDASPEHAPIRLEKLTATGESRMVAISPNGKYIAYTRSIDTRCSIWLRQLATNTNVEIVPASRSVSGLAFANNGQYLYFVQVYPTALYRVSILGGIPTKIVDGLEGIFSISFKDDQVAFVRQEINPQGQQKYSLLIADSDGGNERTVLVRSYPEKLLAPVWSPDSQSIICSYGYSEGGSQDASLVEIRVADGKTRDLSPERFFAITKMGWSPDRTALIMSARKRFGDNNQLWRISYPDMKITQITDGLSFYLDLSVAAQVDSAVATESIGFFDLWTGSAQQPGNLKRLTQANDRFCWTPDDRIVYSSTASGNRDLWIMRRDGSEQKQLTLDAAVDGTPAISLDNRYIVFISNRSGAFQLWRMKVDGSDQIQLTNGDGKDNPAISPDGEWVLYNCTRDLNLWKVSIDGGESTRLTDYIALLPSISPDGRLIACLGRNESKREILIVPFEGGQPLKRFDYPGWRSRLQWTPDGRSVVYAETRGGKTSLMKQSLDGGSPKEIASFEGEQIFDFGYSPDGSYLAVTRGGWQHDIVLISNISQALIRPRPAN